MMHDGLMLLLFAFAALLHGIAGIGFPLVSTSVLSLSHTVQQAVVITLVPTLLVNAASLVGGGRITEIVRAYGLTALGSVLGSFIGVYLLIILSSAPLQILLGVVMLGYIALSLRTRVWHMPQGKTAAFLFGLRQGQLAGRPMRCRRF